MDEVVGTTGSVWDARLIVVQPQSKDHFASLTRSNAKIRSDAIRTPSPPRRQKHRFFSRDKGLCPGHSAPSAACRDIRRVYDWQVSRRPAVGCKHAAQACTHTHTPIHTHMHTTLACIALIVNDGHHAWNCLKHWRQVFIEMMPKMKHTLTHPHWSVSLSLWGPTLTSFHCPFFCAA